MKLVFFTRANGKTPFLAWLQKLDIGIRAMIRSHLDRFANGGGKNNIKNLGDGVSELKIDKGPGYRIYFGEDGKNIVLLLLGGTKRSQKRDIEKAKKYWREYHE